MQKTISELVGEAKMNIENLSPEQVQRELVGGAVLVDIREADELKQRGTIEGSIHVPRGVLEFSADPSSPSYKNVFNKNKKIILHCASGGRSALGVESLKQLGYTNVAHLDGGFNGWEKSGRKVIKKKSFFGWL